MMHEATNPALPPHGRPPRRVPRIVITSFRLEDRLYQRLLAACGVYSAVRWSVDHVLRRHALGDYGHVSDEDRVLNDYVLDAAFRRPPARHVVSVHPAGSLWVRISTDLATGETTIRQTNRPRTASRPTREETA